MSGERTIREGASVIGWLGSNRRWIDAFDHMSTHMTSTCKHVPLIFVSWQLPEMYREKHKHQHPKG